MAWSRERERVLRRAQEAWLGPAATSFECAISFTYGRYGTTLHASTAARRGDHNCSALIVTASAACSSKCSVPPLHKAPAPTAFQPCRLLTHRGETQVVAVAQLAHHKAREDACNGTCNVHTAGNMRTHLVADDAPAEDRVIITSFADVIITACHCMHKLEHTSVT